MPAVALQRVVLVTRRTEYEQLIERHATRRQARFFLKLRGQDMDEVEGRHRLFDEALAGVSSSIPLEWRRTRVDRARLDRFLFEPEDIVVALGQDGLVANVAKYLAGQPVIGLNPDAGRNAGVLVPHPPSAAADLLADVAAGRAGVEELTMVAADLDDGQSLLALNEVFVGHRSHQSARYELGWRDRREMHSSSGLIVTTGTGATGWARSIHRERGSSLELPPPTAAQLAFFVREAWPSIATGTDCTEGALGDGETLTIASRMDGGGVVFGDGIEQDALELPWGTVLTLHVADRRLRLVRG